MEKDKYYFIELMRFLIGINIIMIHIHNQGTNNISSIVINGFGVPLFLMISGFCLFIKPHKYTSQLKKLINKIIIPTIIISSISLVWGDYITGNSGFFECLKNINLKGFIIPIQKILLVNFGEITPLSNHLWYFRLYTIIIVFYPMLRSICTPEKEGKICRHLLLGALLIQILYNDLDHLYSISDKIIYPFYMLNEMQFIYFFIGYELYLKKDKLINGKISGLIIGLVLTIAGIALRFYLYRCLGDNYYYQKETLASLFLTIGLFIFIGNLYFYINKPRLISFLGRMNYYVFLIHYLVIYRMRALNLTFDRLQQYNINIFTQLGYELIYSIIIYIICLIISVLLDYFLKLLRKSFSRLRESNMFKALLIKNI